MTKIKKDTYHPKTPQWTVLVFKIGVLTIQLEREASKLMQRWSFLCSSLTGNKTYKDNKKYRKMNKIKMSFSRAVFN